MSSGASHTSRFDCYSFGATLVCVLFRTQNPAERVKSLHRRTEEAVKAVDTLLAAIREAHVGRSQNVDRNIDFSDLLGLATSATKSDPSHRLRSPVGSAVTAGGLVYFADRILGALDKGAVG
jgi:hypothetical protein